MFGDDILKDGRTYAKKGQSHTKVTFWFTILIQNHIWHPNIDRDNCPQLRNPCAKVGNDILRGSQMPREQIGRQTISKNILQILFFSNFPVCDYTLYKPMGTLPLTSVGTVWLSYLCYCLNWYIEPIFAFHISLPCSIMAPIPGAVIFQVQLSACLL